MLLTETPKRSMKLWPRRRRRDGDGDGDGDDRFLLPTRDDFRPIDTEEQEEMVRTFERNHARQSRLWRGVFGAFLLGYAGFLIYSAFQQALSPWDLRYHAYFMEEVRSWAVIVADWISVLACLLAVKGFLHSSRSYQQWIWSSFCASLLLAFFWLYHMLRLPKFRWDVIWLPFGPLSCAVICLYVDHLLRESFEDIRRLRSYMYNYRTT